MCILMWTQPVRHSWKEDSSQNMDPTYWLSMTKDGMADKKKFKLGNVLHKVGEFPVTLQ